MRLYEVAMLSESPFTPRHFPAAPNKKVVGAGERTVYAELPVNAPGGEGFRVMKPTPVVNGKGITDIKPNQKIFWTMPGKLFTAKELGQKGVSNYAMFGLRSSAPKDAVGLISISTIQKPSKIPSRVLTGKAGQEEVFEYVLAVYGGKFQSVERLSTAGIGSTKADLVISIDGKPVQFEIKNSTSTSAPVTMFDKTVRRDKPNPVIDGLVEIVSGEEGMTLVKMIDRLRLKDRTAAGFPGDKGVGKSGKFVGMRITQDSPHMEAACDFIMEHFAANGDNYFAINYGEGKVEIYWTTFGENLLNRPELPTPQYIDLRTYGGPSGGGMRLGVKVKL